MQELIAANCDILRYQLKYISAFEVLSDIFHRAALGVELPSLPEQSSHSVSRLMLRPLGA